MRALRLYERRTSSPKVLRSSLPVILDFYQASCAPCRALEPRLEQVADQHKGRVKGLPRGPGGRHASR